MRFQGSLKALQCPAEPLPSAAAWSGAKPAGLEMKMAQGWGEGVAGGEESVTRRLAGGMPGKGDEPSLNKSLTHGWRIP